MVGFQIERGAPINTGTGQVPGTTTVTDVSTEIIPANPNRVALVMINVGNNDVWFAYDEDAVLGEGPFLGRSGGSTALDSTFLSTGPVNGICRPGKTSDITFQEYTK